MPFACGPGRKHRVVRVYGARLVTRLFTLGQLAGRIPSGGCGVTVDVILVFFIRIK